MFRNVRNGEHLRQIGDFQQRPVRLHRLAEPRLALRDHTAERRLEDNRRRRIARLPTFEPDDIGAGLNCLAECRFELGNAPGNATADDRASRMHRFDPAEREQRFLEVGLFRFHRLEIQVLYRSFIEDDGVRRAIFIDRMEGYAAGEEKRGDECVAK